MFLPGGVVCGALSLVIENDVNPWKYRVLYKPVSIATLKTEEEKEAFSLTVTMKLKQNSPRVGLRDKVTVYGIEFENIFRNFKCTFGKFFE